MKPKIKSKTNIFETMDKIAQEVSAAQKASIRQGTYDSAKNKEKKLPPRIQELMDEEKSTWDWTMLSVEGVMWVVLRLFDEGVETERVAAIVQDQKLFY